MHHLLPRCGSIDDVEHFIISSRHMAFHGRTQLWLVRRLKLGKPSLLSSVSIDISGGRQDDSVTIYV